jgi:hypothetical protein
MHGWNITLKAVDDASRLTSSLTFAVENATKRLFIAATLFP